MDLLKAAAHSRLFPLPRHASCASRWSSIESVSPKKKETHNFESLWQKKVPLLGSFETYVEQSKKKPQPTGMAQPPNTQNLAQGAQQLLNFGAANPSQKGPAKLGKDANMNAK